MRLETLRLKNFRGYEDSEFRLHPQFNLIVGENGAGKTSFLEAAAVAIGSWMLGIWGHDSRNILERDVRVVREMVEKRYRELPQYPVIVEATGFIHIATVKRSDDGILGYPSSRDSSQPNPREESVTWSRSIDGVGGRTTRSGANSLKKLAEFMASAVISQQPRILPLIRYFGAGRLWDLVRDSDGKMLSRHKGKQPAELAQDADELDRWSLLVDKLSEPFYGYQMSVDKRCNPDDLIRWMALERRNEMDEQEESPALRLVYQAIESLLPEAESVRYSVKLRTLVLDHRDGKRHTFNELSDGYRNMVAIAADLAIKAAMLNPQLAEKALEWTPGVVLIDELDLHLHPKWQRRIIEDLRRTFPKIQFICTTHSPFLIQSLRSGEELIMLDGQPTAQVDNMPIDEIARGLMGVSNTETSARYDEMKQVAKGYLEKLEEADLTPADKLDDFLDHLAQSISPYADNPAFQAFLEMKRAAKLGR